MNNKRKAYLVVLVFWLLALSGQNIQAQLLTITPHDLLPESKISVEGGNAPEWKALWDDARKSALQGNFETALRQYKGLLLLKSNLAEARWELARLMMYLELWDESSELLELLIESEPQNILYVNSLGKVMWEMEHYERAVDLFKKVYEINPSDQTALAGLVEGLNKLDRKKEALPFLDELVRQEPTNRGVRRYLAFLLYESENYQKARAHFTILSRNEDVELDVLFKTARTYERLELDQQASEYWERVLAREHENIEAHIFLAKYYEEIKEPGRSLSHLETMLAQNPDDAVSYARLGETYEMAGEYGKALTYYEKYLVQYPNDHEIMQRILSLKTAKEKKKRRKEILPHYAAIDDQKHIEKLKETIHDLEGSDRYRDAIPVFRQLLEFSAEEPGTLAVLANYLIYIGKNEGTKSMMAFLADVAQANEAIYRSMAELLRRLKREDELVAVLNEIHGLDPGDNFTTQELALLYLNSGDLELSSKFFAKLSDSQCRNVGCLEGRASLAGKLNLPAHRLQDYETLLKLQPSRYEVRLEVIGLAADLGLLDAAVFHAGYLQFFTSVNKNLEPRILLADAYRESGYLTRAIERYHTILEQTSEQTELHHEFRIRSWLGIAESYEKLGLVYEAEQTLRTALVHEENRIRVIEALFYLFLETDRINESEIWLRRLNSEIEESQKFGPRQDNWDWKKEFFQAEMYGAGNDHDLAIDLYRQAEALLPRIESEKTVVYGSKVVATGFLIRAQMALSLLRTGDYNEAEKIVLELQKSDAEELEFQVLLEQIYRAWGKDVKADNWAEKAKDYAARDFGRQLNLARLYEKYKDTSRQYEAAGKALTHGFDSLVPQYLLVDVRIKQGDYPAALELLDRFLQNYPENTWFLSQQAELLAKVGSYQEALDAAEMILTDSSGRLDIVLLQARILWEMNRWKDSVSLYETVVEPAVEEILEKEIKELSVIVDQPSVRNSWWDVITFSEGTQLSISDAIMSPLQALDNSESGQAVNSVAARYYALYRWQDRFNKELSVRRSVIRREYYHAANKLENVIEEYGSSDFLLYDLAGLYSKLDRLGDETILYRELETHNANFPGLTEAIQRNNLKRRPQVFLSYIMQDDDGWDGYKSVRQEIIKGGGKYFQASNQEWGF